MSKAGGCLTVLGVLVLAGRCVGDAAAEDACQNWNHAVLDAVGDGGITGWALIVTGPILAVNTPPLSGGTLLAILMLAVGCTSVGSVAPLPPATARLRVDNQ